MHEMQDSAVSDVTWIFQGRCSMEREADSCYGDGHFKTGGLVKLLGSLSLEASVHFSRVLDQACFVAPKSGAIRIQGYMDTPGASTAFSVFPASMR